MIWLLLLSLFGISLVSAFRGIRLNHWTIAITVVLAGFSFFTNTSTLAIVILSVLFAGIAFPLNYLPIRRRWLSEPFLEMYRKMLPTLSETEQVALDAGTVGWEGELFAGNPDWDI